MLTHRVIRVKPVGAREVLRMAAGTGSGCPPVTVSLQGYVVSGGIGVWSAGSRSPRPCSLNSVTSWPWRGALSAKGQVNICRVNECVWNLGGGGVGGSPGTMNLLKGENLPWDS